MATVAATATTEWAGTAVVKIPRNTQAVFSATTDADYDQRFAGHTSNSGTNPLTWAFVGQGRKGKAMTLEQGVNEYMEYKPAGEDRDIVLTFQYKPQGGTQWKVPKVRRKPDYKINNQVDGVTVITIGTEDGVDESYTDTLVTVCLFRKTLSVQ